MVKVEIKNKQTQEITHMAQFPTQIEADTWIAKQKAKGAKCAWGRPAYTEYQPILDEENEPVLDEQGEPTYNVIEHEDEFEIIVTDITAQTQTRAILAVVSGARVFGTNLLDQFAAENVMLGITQDGLTGQVLDIMQPVMTALLAGSLDEAMNRIRAIDVEDKDEKYITDARLLEYINKIETYLELPLSTVL